MKYFLDTEFIEGSHRAKWSKISRFFVDLISIGIVAEDGRTYYAVSNEYRYELANEWVKENVIIPAYTNLVHGDQRNELHVYNFHKHLGKSTEQIKLELLEFFGCWRDQHFWRAGKDEPQIYGYFADYDWVLLCSLFGRMIDLPKGFPMYCLDLKQMMDERGLSKEWKKENCPDPTDQHNALADAKWNQKLYNAILNYRPLILKEEKA